MIKRWCLLATLFLASAAMAAVDVNKATEADLDGLNGVGPATTQLILKERKKGDFKDWADLMHRVKGIGDARANKLSGGRAHGERRQLQGQAAQRQRESRQGGPEISR